MKQTITSIRDFQVGKEIQSSSILQTQTEKDIFLLRRNLLDIAKHDKEKHLVCAVCNQPVTLAGGKKTKKRLHFRHYQDTANCPITTKGQYSQQDIDTMRYNGAKESLRHKKLKEFIFSYIQQDERFTDEQMEAVVKSLIETKKWRRPDVSSNFLDKKLVFEIQLQTTYLSVITDREQFYQNNQTYIMWFFDTTNISEFRFSEKDIFYANKSNAFVITNESMEQSRKENRLLFYCYYPIPHINNNMIKYTSAQQLISIDDLQFDDQNYKVFFYDFDSEESKLKNILNHYLEHPWLSSFWAECEESNSQTIIHEFSEIFYVNDVRDFEMTYELTKILNSIHSLQINKIVGYNFSNFPQLANNFLEHYQDFTAIFLWAITIYGSREVIEKINRNEAFKKKVTRYKEKRKDSECEQTHKYDKLFSVLFPELKPKLQLQ